MTRTYATLTLATLSTLAALGLAAARPADAQEVNLVLGDGDAVTVSGAGTSGAYHGALVGPPMSGYTSYTDDNTKNSSGNYAAVETDGTASFALGMGGGVNDANGEYGLYATGSGLISITGGAIVGTTADNFYTLYATGSSPISMSGGSISTVGSGAYGLYDTGTGLVTLSGGTISGPVGGEGVEADGVAGLILSGTAITGGDDGVYAQGGGPITMTGGSITTLPNASSFPGGTGLYAQNTGLVTLSGGTITGGTPSDTTSGIAVDAENSDVLVNGATISATGYSGVGLLAFGTHSVSVTSGSITGGDSSSGLEDFSTGLVTVSGGAISAGQDSFALDADAGQTFSNGQTVNRTGAVVRISNGTITGGQGSDGVRAGSADTVIITGGAITGGDNDRTGAVAGVDAEVNSTVTISGGTIVGGAAGGGQNANSVASGVLAGGSSRVTFSGGGVTTGFGGDGVYATGSATLTMTGGTITQTDGDQSTAIGAGSGGTVLVTGGQLGRGQFEGLKPDSGGLIDLFGTNFSYTDQNGVTTALASGVLSATYGSITGTLLDGEALDTNYLNTNGGTIEVNVGPAPAPEPSQTAALGLGMLGLAGLGWKARRRTA